MRWLLEKRSGVGTGDVGFGVGDLLRRRPVHRQARPFPAQDIEGLPDALVLRRHRTHDEAGVIQRHQVGGDGIGEAALLPHLLGEPRRETAAAEDVVHDIGGEEIGIVPLEAFMAEQHHALGDIAVDDDGRAAIGRRGLGDGGQIGLLRQRAEGLVQQHAQIRRGDVADHADDQIVAGEDALHIGAEILDGDRLEARLGAAGLAAIGMAGIAQTPPGAVGDGRGIADIAGDGAQELAAEPLHRIGVEARLGQAKPKQIERPIAILRQGAEAAAELVHAGIEAPVDGEVVERLLEPAESRSPAPSSSRPDSRLVRPSLPAGSSTEPPRKARLSEIRGML